jgi:hypothetical protein
VYCAFGLWYDLRLSPYKILDTSAAGPASWNLAIWVLKLSRNKQKFQQILEICKKSVTLLSQQLVIATSEPLKNYLPSLTILAHVAHGFFNHLLTENRGLVIADENFIRDGERSEADNQAEVEQLPSDRVEPDGTRTVAGKFPAQKGGPSLVASTKFSTCTIDTACQKIASAVTKLTSAVPKTSPRRAKTKLRRAKTSLRRDKNNLRNAKTSLRRAKTSFRRAKTSLRRAKTSLRRAKNSLHRAKN